MKILNLDDMLGVAEELKLPEYSNLVALAEATSNLVAQAIAARLGVAAGDADWEGIAFGGLCVRFRPAMLDQVCPEVIHAADPDGEWE